MKPNKEEALIEIKTEDLAKRSLIIGTPCYGGMMMAGFAGSLINLIRHSHEIGLQVDFASIQNESLITRARNNIVALFLESNRDYLMFIDADIEFNYQDVWGLLALCSEEEMPIITGSYPKKSINWNMISEAVKRGVPPEELKYYTDNPVINFKRPDDGSQFSSIRLNKPVEVLDAGTGFMMIHRSVFLKMKEAYPNLAYIPDYNLSMSSFDNRKERRVWAFFDTMIVPDETAGGNPENMRYLSEDYAFCYLWRKLGGKIYMCPWINLTHTGTYQFHGNMIKTLSLRTAITHEQIAQGKIEPPLQKRRMGKKL